MRLDKESPNAHGMLFYTEDGYMIYGVSRDTYEVETNRKPERCLEEMQEFLETNIGYITHECPPESTHEEFLNRTQKKKLSITFQDINTTNTLLKKDSITLKNIDIYTPKELCKILDVDAIISGSLTSRMLISKEVDTSFDLITFLKGKSDYGKIIIKLSDRNSGKLLWRYEKTINRKSGKNTNAIISSMMRKASRKFPYEKDK